MTTLAASVACVLSTPQLVAGLVYTHSHDKRMCCCCVIVDEGPWKSQLPPTLSAGAVSVDNVMFSDPPLRWSIASGAVVYAPGNELTAQVKNSEHFFDMDCGYLASSKHNGT